MLVVLVLDVVVLVDVLGPGVDDELLDTSILLLGVVAVESVWLC